MNDRRSFYSRGLPSKAKGQAKETTLPSSILTSSTLSDQSGQKLTTSTKPASADSECFSISLEYCPRCFYVVYLKLKNFYSNKYVLLVKCIAISMCIFLYFENIGDL